MKRLDENITVPDTGRFGGWEVYTFCDRCVGADAHEQKPITERSIHTLFLATFSGIFWYIQEWIDLVNYKANLHIYSQLPFFP